MDLDKKWNLKKILVLALEKYNLDKFVKLNDEFLTNKLSPIYELLKNLRKTKKLKIKT